jgi:3-oxoacyl-[acyl-carrier protein] reductase
MKVNLEGRVALVTGAGRGIGRAIADALAENGARVVFTDVDLNAVEVAAARWPGCTAQALDVSNESEVDEILESIPQELGHLDILVNNAGVNVTHRVPVDELPTDDWERVLQVDLHGLFLVSRAAARVMRRQASGRIINIASVLALVPARLQCAYVAAKGGVVSLTKAMAIELGSSGVLVNAVAPGSTLTEMTRKLFYDDDGNTQAAAQRLLDHIPLGRPAQPEEIAHAVLFLAAPESSYITGQVLSVDGGWTAGYLRDF